MKIYSALETIEIFQLNISSFKTFLSDGLFYYSHLYKNVNLFIVIKIIALLLRLSDSS